MAKERAPLVIVHGHHKIYVNDPDLVDRTFKALGLCPAALSREPSLPARCREQPGRSAGEDDESGCFDVGEAPAVSASARCIRAVTAECQAEQQVLPDATAGRRAKRARRMRLAAGSAASPPPASAPREATPVVKAGEVQLPEPCPSGCAAPAPCEWQTSQHQFVVRVPSLVGHVSAVGTLGCGVLSVHNLPVLSVFPSSFTGAVQDEVTDLSSDGVGRDAPDRCGQALLEVPQGRGMTMWALSTAACRLQWRRQRRGRGSGC